jgi:DNA-binding NtrC family response regulator
MQTLLIAEDEASMRDGLKAALDGHDLNILTAENGAEALEILEREPVDLLVSDIKMPVMDGLTLQDKARRIDPDLPVILLTAYGTVENAVEAMRRGAYDFVTKPINIDKFELLVLRALESRKMNEENQRLKKALHKRYGLHNLVGRSRPMKELFEQIRTVAKTRSTVMIYGESGTGKELIASAIHELSPRNRGPFVVVNCAALSENLLESELFGHEKGAFTGATRNKEGRFKIADKGTLFLDEIAELTPRIQVKLLRVIQEKSFEPVGSSKSVKVDVRFITATNKDLDALVRDNRFREDLYFRLNVLKIESPPLRERREDIPLLVNHFLTEFSREMGKHVDRLSSAAMDELLRYEWPGNVRELKNVIENLVVFARDTVIPKEALPKNILKQAPVSPPSSKKNGGTLNLAENEKRLIQKALEETRYNKTAAAEKLGMSRRTIHRKIKEYGIET